MTHVENVQLEVSEKLPRGNLLVVRSCYAIEALAEKKKWERTEKRKRGERNIMWTKKEQLA